MQRNKFSRIFDRDLAILDKPKKYFIISAAIILTSIIVMIVCSFFPDSTGGALNFGMDFAGGYSIDIRLGSRIDTDEKYNEMVRQITDIIENATDDDGVPFGVKVKQTQKQGENAEATINVRYKGVVYKDESGDDVMNDIVNPAIEQALRNNLFVPSDKYKGDVTLNGSIGSSVSSELMYGAISAVILATVLMFIYIMFRFQPIAGVAAIIAQLHDVMIIIAFMAFTRIQVNSTFIASIITIMGYAINNTIIIFDRIRELMGKSENRLLTSKEIGNKAIKQSLGRTLITTLTTFIPIFLITIIGVPSIREFSAPIIIGLISGMYSSNCLAPSVWALLSGKRKSVRQPAKKFYTERT